MRRTITIMLVLFAAVLLWGGSSHALRLSDLSDDLRLTGIVKKVDAATGLVYVEVLTSGCEGLRVFKADQPKKLEQYVDEKVSFFIDSNRCRAKETHGIVVSRGVKKW